MESVTLRAPEVRTYPALELREIEATKGAGGLWLEGRAVPYDTWTDVGWFMERITRGAFKKSIREAAAGLPLLLWHDNRTFPIGVSTEWRESDDGLDGVWRLDDQDPLAVEGARKAAAGMLTGMSVGFSPMVEEDDIELDDNGLPWITRSQARLLEVSLTPTPAYAGAQVSLVRSRAAQQQRGERRRSAEIDSWRAFAEQARQR
ncbi:HK97 family phage prohead protease [Microlunatus parietis]|uniref:Prohead serine protease domain-containing protein n=1 Tax=Microlunatus parietis TaxID=682979 RepID=A0A7Y9I257_9ACTN|nr:HK97 family phage prohead protease [Microlunatus parietis]NYE68868.1 hypothetical protein [Microlunatus parietis]